MFFSSIVVGSSIFNLLDNILMRNSNLIFNTLNQVDDNRTRAAELLGISIRTLRNKLHEYKEEAAGS